MAVILQLLLLLCIFCGVVIGIRPFSQNQIERTEESSNHHVYEVYAPDMTDSEKVIYAKSFTRKTTQNNNNNIINNNNNNNNNNNFEVKTTKESSVMKQLGYVITIAFSILFYPFVFPVLLALFNFLKSFFIANILKIITFSFASIVIFCNATNYCNAYGFGGKTVEDEVRGIMKNIASDKVDNNLLSYIVNQAIEKHNKQNRKEDTVYW